MAPATSRRQRIIEWFLGQLQTIATSGGFATNAGATVYCGFVPELGPDDPLVAIALTVGPDEPSVNMEHVFVRLPIRIHALASASASAPWEAAEAVLRDIKEAIETNDRTLGKLLPRQLERGQTETFERRSSSQTTGIKITYWAPYAEQWGGPSR